MHGINRSYNHLRHSDAPIGDGVLFGDLSQSVKDAKACQNMSKNLQRQTFGQNRGRKRPFQKGNSKWKQHKKPNNNNNNRK